MLFHWKLLESFSEWCVGDRWFIYLFEDFVWWSFEKVPLADFLFGYWILKLLIAVQREGVWETTMHPAIMYSTQVLQLLVCV